MKLNRNAHFLLMKEFYLQVFGIRVGLPHRNEIFTTHIMPHILLIPKGLDYDMVESALARVGITYWKWTEEPLSQVINLRKEERYSIGRLFPKHRTYKRAGTPQRKPKPIKKVHTSYVIAHFGVPGDHRGCIRNLQTLEEFGNMTLLEALVYEMYVRWILSIRTGMTIEFLRTLPLDIPSTLGTLCTGSYIENGCAISVQHMPKSNKLYIRTHQRSKQRIIHQPRQVNRIF